MIITDGFNIFVRIGFTGEAWVYGKHRFMGRTFVRMVSDESLYELCKKAVGDNHSCYEKVLVKGDARDAIVFMLNALEQL